VEVIEERTHSFRLGRAPGQIGIRRELDDLVAHARQGAQRTFEVFAEMATDGEKLQPDRGTLALSKKSTGRNSRGSKEPATGKGIGRSHGAVVDGACRRFPPWPAGCGQSSPRHVAMQASVKKSSA